MRIYLLAAAVAALLRPVPAWGELYVLNSGRPAISVVDPVTLKATGEIPIPPDVSCAVLDPERRRVFLVYSGIFNSQGKVRDTPARGRIAVLDLVGRTIVREVPAGWNAERLLHSADGKRLYCLNNGWRYVPDRKGKRTVEDPDGSVTVIDSASLEVVATLTPGRLVSALQETADGKFLVVLAGGSLYLDKPHGPYEADPARAWRYTGKRAESMDARLAVYSLATLEKVREVRLEGAPTELFLGNGIAYALDRGLPHFQKKKRRLGRVLGVDLPSGETLVNAPAGAMALPVRWDEEKGELDLVTQESFTSNSNLALQEIRPSGSGPAAALMPFGGMLSAVLPLAGGNRAIAAFTSLEIPSSPRSHLAMMDLPAGKPVQRIEIGSKGVRFAKSAALFTAMGAGMFFAMIPTYAIMAGAGAHMSGEQVRQHLPETVIADPDGSLLYALDPWSNRVSLIRTADGSVVENLEVGGGCKRVTVAPGERFVLVQGDLHVVWIDRSSRKKAGEYAFENGRVLALQPDPERRRVLVLGDDFIASWDAQSGNMGKPVKGYRGPFQAFWTPE